MKLFAFDNRFSSVSNAELTTAPIKKNGVMLDRAMGLPESMLTIFPSSILPMPNGGYWMYYSAYTLHNPVMKIGIAHSSDGYNWEHEKLTQTLINGDKTPYIKIKGLPENAMVIQPIVILLPNQIWRMYFWLHGGMIRFVCAESKNGIDWQILNLDSPCLYHPGDEQVRACLGDDVSDMRNLLSYDLNKNSRLDFKMGSGSPQIKKLLSNDATTVYYNSKADIFEMFSVWLLNNPEKGKHWVAHDNAPCVLRVIHRRTSKNGLDWSDPELVVLPDDKDPDDLQFYYMTNEYLENGRIGFLGHYLCNSQTMDVELCLSADGRNWSRPLRKPWLPRGESGEPDSMGIYSAANLVHAERECIYYYTAYDSGHNAFLKGIRPKSAIMAGTFGENRFIGLSSCMHSQNSVIKTAPIILTQKTIKINAAIRGSLRAQLSVPFGEVIPGCEYTSSLEIKGDSLNHALSWKGRTIQDLLYKGIVIELCLNDGTIYSIDL